MKAIDTLPLSRSPYGDTDTWTSTDEHDGTRPIQLRMRCRYTRQVERLTVLYTGPDGASRIDHGGPQVPGPHGVLIPQATVISAHPGVQPVFIDVEEGDVIVLNGQRMVIADNRIMGYPHLVTETEWGLITAQRTILDQISALGSDHTDPAVRALRDALGKMTAQIEPLRARYRNTDTDTHTPMPSS